MGEDGPDPTGMRKDDRVLVLFKKAIDETDASINEHLGCFTFRWRFMQDIFTPCLDLIDGKVVPESILPLAKMEFHQIGILVDLMEAERFGEREATAEWTGIDLKWGEIGELTTEMFDLIFKTIGKRHIGLAVTGSGSTSYGGMSYEIKFHEIPRMLSGYFWQESILEAVSPCLTWKLKSLPFSNLFGL